MKTPYDGTGTDWKQMDERGPMDFQTEHATIDEKKIYAMAFPKRLPRKLKKKYKKIDAEMNEIWNEGKIFLNYLKP